jgi:hypothetical protein
MDQNWHLWGEWLTLAMVWDPDRSPGPIANLTSDLRHITFTPGLGFPIYKTEDVLNDGL